MLAKQEWGVKRSCLACSTRFYDMQRNPMVCPKCGAEFHPEMALRARRVRATSDKPAAVKVVKPVAVVVENETDADEPEVAVDSDDDTAVASDGDDEDVIEDTSDLGDDDADVPRVADALDDEKAAD